MRTARLSTRVDGANLQGTLNPWRLSRSPGNSATKRLSKPLRIVVIEEPGRESDRAVDFNKHGASLSQRDIGIEEWRIGRESSMREDSQVDAFLEVGNGRSF